MKYKVLKQNYLTIITFIGNVLFVIVTSCTIYKRKFAIMTNMCNLIISLEIKTKLKKCPAKLPVLCSINSL